MVSKLIVFDMNKKSHPASIYIYIYIYDRVKSAGWPSRLWLQNTLTASLQRGKTPPTSVLDITLSNLMVRL